MFRESNFNAISTIWLEWEACDPQLYSKYSMEEFSSRQKNWSCQIANTSSAILNVLLLFETKYNKLIPFNVIATIQCLILAHFERETKSPIYLGYNKFSTSLNNLFVASFLFDIQSWSKQLVHILTNIRLSTNWLTDLWVKVMIVSKVVVSMIKI